MSNIHQIGANVDRFLTFYREHFPNSTITPKMHMLEDHMDEWMHRWHWAPGFHSEQGAESIHAIFNRLRSTYSSVKIATEQLILVVKAHHLSIHPSNSASEENPSTKRRKVQGQNIEQQQ
jgi:hypothetical protein